MCIGQGHTCNPNTLEAKVGESWGYPGLKENLSQKKKNDPNNKIAAQGLYFQEGI
jgi:hypothetical protein